VSTGGGSTPDVEVFPFPSASLLVEDGQFRFKLYLDDTEVLNAALGKGFDENIFTIQDLQNLINGVDNFTCEVDANLLSLPAAFIPVFSDTAFTDQTNLALTVYYQEAVPYPTGSELPFRLLAAMRSEDGFRLASAAGLRDALYIASGFDQLIKYDGQKTYRAGLPSGAAPTAAATGTGAVPGTNVRYRYRYVQVDANGFEHSGTISPVSGAVSPGGTQRVNVTVPNIDNATGFNTDMAVLEAAPVTQTGTTFACSHNTLKVGDTIYFIDNSGVRYDSRTVVLSSPSSISISGTAVTLGALSVISANLRVRLYRQEIQDGEYFFVNDYPHDSRAPFTVSDNAPTTGAQYVTPANLPGLPPSEMYYITEHQGLLFAANGDTVYYSNPESPEGWTALRSFDVVGGGPITALAANNEFLLVFKARSIHSVTGTVTDGNYRVDLVTRDVGCASHHSIQDISGTIIFASDRGVYAITGIELPQNIGQQVVPLFIDRKLDVNEQLVLKRSIAIHDPNKQDYMLFIPAESVSNGERYANDKSIVLVYNYYRKHWLLWDNLNWAGGGAMVDGELWTAERSFSAYTGNLATKKAKRLDRGYWIDYADHNEAQEFEYYSGWETLEQPTAYKKFTRFKLYSNDPSLIGNFNVRVVTEKNFIEGVYESDFPLDFASTASSEGGWSLGPWGRFPWGDPSVPWLSVRLKGSKATALRAGFLHQELYRQPLITGWDMEVNTVFERKSVK
jgi:hypothetical protein